MKMDFIRTKNIKNMKFNFIKFWAENAKMEPRLLWSIFCRPSAHPENQEARALSLETNTVVVSLAHLSNSISFPSISSPFAVFDSVFQSRRWRLSSDFKAQ